MPNIKNQGLRRVQVLQNRIMRILTGLHYWNTSPSDLLRSFNILNVTERLDCFNCIQVFKCPSNTAPVYMSDIVLIVYYLNVTERLDCFNCIQRRI